MNHTWWSEIVISKLLFVFLILKDLIFKSFIIFFSSLIFQNQRYSYHMCMVNLTIINSFRFFFLFFSLWFSLSNTFPILCTLYSLIIYFYTIERFWIHVKDRHSIITLSNLKWLKLIITSTCAFLGYVYWSWTFSWSFFPCLFWSWYI